MAFAPSASWNSRSITHLVSYLSQNSPTNSSDEPKMCRFIPALSRQSSPPAMSFWLTERRCRTCPKSNRALASTDISTLVGLRDQPSRP
jgi:hypothetical protein